jgi:hypothetical protein
VWGPEFTSKDAALQGGSSRNRCWAERKIVAFYAWLTGGGGGELPFPGTAEPTEIRNFAERFEALMVV